MTIREEEAKPVPTKAGVPIWVKAALIGASVLVIALVAVVAVLATKVSEPDETTGASDTAGSDEKVFTASGDITLTSYDGVFNAGGGECTGTGGYDDIAAGAQVVIRNSVGQTLAAGGLERGEKQGPSTCRFPFEVEVPIDDGPYSVEVSHRGEIAFTEDDAENLHLTLG